MIKLPLDPYLPDSRSSDLPPRRLLLHWEGQGSPTFDISVRSRFHPAKEQKPNERGQEGDQLDNASERGRPSISWLGGGRRKFPFSFQMRREKKTGISMAFGLSRLAGIMGAKRGVWKGRKEKE